MAGQPCPRCGGTDRFFLVARPRKGGAPFWLCAQCRHVKPTSESDGASMDRAAPTSYRGEELRRIQRGYAAVAEWCAIALWSPLPEARAALAYLRSRGLKDETIIAARLGFHPRPWNHAKTGDAARDYGVGAVLYHRDRDAYDGAQRGGLIGPQGQPKAILRGTITIPYLHGGTTTLLRARALDPAAKVKYLSPAGVTLYAGAPPTLYGQDQLDNPEVREVILTEGEFKALLCQQHGIPAVAQPGIGFLPDDWVRALGHRTVVVGYDVEARSDPFTPSPGERFSLRVAERLTGSDLKAKLAQARQALADIKAAAKHTTSPEEEIQLLERFERESLAADKLQADLALLEAAGIQAKVLRLPRDPDQVKVDLDSFILQHGPDRLQSLIRHAPTADDWYARHAGGGYSYEKGGIYNGKLIANYQARIMETILQSDGQQITALQRLILRTPGGRLLTYDMSDEDWADDRAARKGLRTGLREGVYDDDAREVLRAIRLLSSQGDPPIERSVFTATGWERIRERWHFLSSDGAITARGPTTNVKAEIDDAATGNHYAMCGPGDATQGAQAWLAFLRGEVCPQPLALILAAQAALPLIHRFSGTTARTMLWLFHQSGALKTALTRAAVMALYGPSFTAERADGAPVPKWDSTNVGLGYLVFYYRDMPLLIDDYKQGVIDQNQFKKFLHNYSESTGRTRATKYQTIDRQKAARCIVFATAEDLPSIGDYGMEARLLAMQLHPSATNPDALATLQRAGVAGHLAAFWRGLVAQIAQELDQHGEAGLRTQLQRLLAADEEQLPGHRRAAGALRQNRMAWLILSAWLQRAGVVTAAEADTLNAAHLEARALLAQLLTERQRDSKPSAIFLGVLSELLQSGDLLIERPHMTCPRCQAALQFSDDAWYCTGTIGDRDIPCNYQLSAARIVGFACDDGTIGLFADKAFREVSRVRNDQRQPIPFSSTAIWQQLDADGLLVAKGKDGRYQVQRRNPARLDAQGYGKPAKVLLLKAVALEGGGGDGAEALVVENHDQGSESMGSMGSWDQNRSSGQQDAELPSTGHGIERDQTGPRAGSEPLAQASLIPLDPIRSHAWDQDFAASGRAAPSLDPMIPWNRSQSHAREQPDALPPLDPAILRGYLGSIQPSDQARARELCARYGLDYVALHRAAHGYAPLDD